MSKERKRSKDKKKPPQHTAKEKRAAKIRNKRTEGGLLDNIPDR